MYADLALFCVNQLQSVLNAADLLIGSLPWFGQISAFTGKNYADCLCNRFNSENALSLKILMLVLNFLAGGTPSYLHIVHLIYV